jgi:phage terminase small subunit
MSPDSPKAGLLAWQWQGYARYHQSRANLLLHIVLVPLFLAGNVALIVGLFRLDWIEALVGFASMAVSMAIQGRGHRIEEVAPVPFSDPANALSRIFLEQWITFPRFVLTGGWWRALRLPQ